MYTFELEMRYTQAYKLHHAMPALLKGPGIRSIIQNGPSGAWVNGDANSKQELEEFIVRNKNLAKANNLEVTQTVFGENR